MRIDDWAVVALLTAATSNNLSFAFVLPSQRQLDGRRPMQQRQHLLAPPLHMAAEEYQPLDDYDNTQSNNKAKTKTKKLTATELKRLELQQAIQDAEAQRVSALDLEEEAQERRGELEQQIAQTRQRLEDFEAEEARQAELKRTLTSPTASDAVIGVVGPLAAAVGGLVAARSFLERRKIKIEQERQRLEEELKKKEEELSKTSVSNQRTYNLMSAAAIGSAVFVGATENGKDKLFEYFDSLSLGKVSQSVRQESSKALSMGENNFELPYLEERIDATKARLEEEERMRIAEEAERQRIAEEERIREERERERAKAAEEEERLRAAAEEEKARMRAQEEEILRLQRAEEEEAARARAAVAELQRLRVEDEESKSMIEQERVEGLKQQIAEARRAQAEREFARRQRIEQLTSSPKQAVGKVLTAFADDNGAAAKVAGVGAFLAGAAAIAGASFKILQEKGIGRKPLEPDERIVNESMFGDNDRDGGPPKPLEGLSGRPTANGGSPNQSSPFAPKTSSGVSNNGQLNGDSSVRSKEEPPFFSASRPTQAPRDNNRPQPNSFVFEKKSTAPSFSSNGITTKDKHGNTLNIPPPGSSSLSNQKPTFLKPPPLPTIPSSSTTDFHGKDLNGSKVQSSTKKSFSPYGSSSWKSTSQPSSSGRGGGGGDNALYSPPSQDHKRTQESRPQVSVGPGGQFSGGSTEAVPAMGFSKAASGKKQVQEVRDTTTPPVPQSTPKTALQTETRSSFSPFEQKPVVPSSGSSFSSPPTPPAAPANQATTTRNVSSDKQTFSPFQRLSNTSSTTFGSGAKLTPPPTTKQQPFSSGSLEESSSSTEQTKQQSTLPFGSSPDSFGLTDPKSDSPSMATSRGDDMYARLRKEQEKAELRSSSKDRKAEPPLNSGQDGAPKKSFSPFGGSKPAAASTGDTLYAPPSVQSTSSELPQDESYLKLREHQQATSSVRQSPPSSAETEKKGNPWSSFSPYGKIADKPQAGSISDSLYTPPSNTSSMPMNPVKSDLPTSTSEALEVPKRSFSPFGTGQKPQSPGQKKVTDAVLSPSSMKDTGSSASTPSNAPQQSVFSKLREEAETRQSSPGFKTSGSPRAATEFEGSQRAATTSFSFSPQGTSPKSPPKGANPSSPLPLPKSTPNESPAKPFAASAEPSMNRPKSSGRMDEVNRRSEQKSGLTGGYGEGAAIQKERSRLREMEEARKRAMSRIQKGGPNSDPTEAHDQQRQGQQPVPQVRVGFDQPKVKPASQPQQHPPRRQQEQQQMQRQMQPRPNAQTSPFQQRTAQTQPSQNQQPRPTLQSNQRAAPNQQARQGSSFQQQTAQSSPFQQQIRPATQPSSPRQRQSPDPPKSIAERQKMNTANIAQNSELTRVILNADANYVPSKQALMADSSAPLLREVDGDLSYFANYGSDSVSEAAADAPMVENGDTPKETLYKASNINVHGDSVVSIPIRVSKAGSFVEYTIEKKSHDFLFGIVSRVGQGQETVKEMERFDGSSRHLSAAEAANGQMKIVTDCIFVGPGSAPCVLNFNFENKNPWTLQLSYSVRVISPSKDTIVAGRRNRAMSALRYLDSDLQALGERQSVVSNECRMMQQEIEDLQKQMNEVTGGTPRPQSRQQPRRQMLRSNTWPPDGVDFNP